jgi:Xaa-Pro aminopeptidase
VDFADLAPGPEPQLGREVFEKRRAAAAERLADNEVLVVATHEEALHSHDVHHRFRPHSDFWYLTGFAEAEAVLVLAGDTGASTLFARERKPEAEVWTGRRLGVEAATDVLGVDAVHPFDAIGRLPAFVAGKDALAIVAHHRGVAPVLEGDEVRARRLLSELRVRKGPEEIRLLRQAAHVGNAAHEAAWPEVRAGRNEFHVEARLRATYAAAGSTGPGYPPIVGAGANAAVLHYIDNRAPIRAGDLVLIDAGCEWGYYNSDITRTVPADGAWTDSQRAWYEIVVRAQDAARAQVRPGNPFAAPHKAAIRVLAEGLVELGWVEGDADDAIKAESYRRFFMHGTSHFLGLDVHDPGRVKDDGGASRVLEPGMVLTIEPGLYANADFTDLPAGVAPFGIRIENDVIVTEDGCEDLQASLARDPDDVSARVRGR